MNIRIVYVSFLKWMKLPENIKIDDNDDPHNQFQLSFV